MRTEPGERNMARAAVRAARFAAFVSAGTGSRGTAPRGGASASWGSVHSSVWFAVPAESLHVPCWHTPAGRSQCSRAAADPRPDALVWTLEAICFFCFLFGPLEASECARVLCSHDGFHAGLRLGGCKGMAQILLQCLSKNKSWETLVCVNENV